MNIGKKLPSLMSLNFCHDIQMVESEFNQHESMDPIWPVVQVGGTHLEP